MNDADPPAQVPIIVHARLWFAAAVWILKLALRLGLIREKIVDGQLMSGLHRAARWLADHAFYELGK